jgi:hypothetical protein
MFEDKKPTPKPKEQNPLWWLLGFKETESEKKAREDREAQEKRSREVVESAVRGGQLPSAKKKK